MQPIFGNFCDANTRKYDLLNVFFLYSDHVCVCLKGIQIESHSVIANKILIPETLNPDKCFLIFNFSSGFLSSDCLVCRIWNVIRLVTYFLDLSHPRSAKCTFV